MDTEKISLMNFAVQYIADFWSRFFSPGPYDRVVIVNGQRVRVRVERYERPDDTKPVRTLEDMKPDVSADS